MRKLVTLILACCACLPTMAQRRLSLDSCRAMAIRNNKQLNAARLQVDVTENTRRAARTNYLPKVDAMGAYEFTSKEVSILSKDQRNTLNNLGSLGVSGLSDHATSSITALVQQGLITPQAAQQMGQLLGQFTGPIAEAGNSLGRQITDAFRTNTRNLWAGSVMLRQPLYLGGAITAENKIAEQANLLAQNNLDFRTQSTLYDIDQAYWQVVSLKEKQRLAYSYRDLVKKLSSDVRKMIDQGVATRADGLRVDVKVNEADMQITQVDDGVVLSKMLLCQLIGLPLNEQITLEDEDKQTLNTIEENVTYQPDSTVSSRPEIRMLENTVEMARQNTKLVRSAFLPHLAMTGGYMISNPNVFNGFERKFSGVWNVGVLFQMPLWNWGEGKYKVRAAKSAANIAQMELNDTREKIQLQIQQSRFKLDEAYKRLTMARNNIASAEENLRCANIGFKEGVMETTDVMAAQTAWNQAQSQLIDAEVDVKLAQVNLKKALGILN